jgi:tetratricopeptide (TPR) repeat protein
MSRALIAALLLITATARAQEDAKTLFERGTALFALHKFGDAAVVFEHAFELKPDPAILYNAAQAHRLASHSARALELYESLLKLYGSKLSNREEIVDHIKQLRAAVDAEQRARRTSRCL